MDAEKGYPTYSTASVKFLSWTRALFKLYGLNLKSYSSSSSADKNGVSIKIKRPNLMLIISRLIFLTGLSLRIYKLVALNTGGGLVDISLIISILSVLITHQIIDKNHSKICLIIESASVIFSEDQKMKIVKFDKKINMITIIICVIEYVILSIYSYYEGPFEAILMITGFKVDSWKSDAGPKDGNKNNAKDGLDMNNDLASFVTVQIVFASVSYRFMALIVSHIYYVVVQYVSLIYADIVYDSVLYHHIANANVGVYDRRRDWQAKVGVSKVITIKSIKSLIRLIECYNEMKDRINIYLGMIPFILMASFFAHISSGTAHIILQRPNFKLIFMVIVLSTIIIWFLLMTLIMIELASASHDKMVISKTLLIRILSASLSDHHSDLIRSNSEIEKFKISLLMYISNLKVTPSLAFNMFKINRSLILKFTSSIVPLTVMIIETSIQISINDVNRDANHNNITSGV